MTSVTCLLYWCRRGWNLGLEMKIFSSSWCYRVVNWHPRNSEGSRNENQKGKVCCVIYCWECRWTLKKMLEFWNSPKKKINEKFTGIKRCWIFYIQHYWHSRNANDKVHQIFTIMMVVEWKRRFMSDNKRWCNIALNDKIVMRKRRMRIEECAIFQIYFSSLLALQFSVMNRQTLTLFTFLLSATQTRGFHSIQIEIQFPFWISLFTKISQFSTMIRFFISFDGLHANEEAAEKWTFYWIYFKKLKLKLFWENK